MENKDLILTKKEHESKYGISVVKIYFEQDILNEVEYLTIRFDGFAGVNFSMTISPAALDYARTLKHALTLATDIAYNKNYEVKKVIYFTKDSAVYYDKMTEILGNEIREYHKRIKSTLGLEYKYVK